MKYIIFDLEATCWENDKKKQSEIIEIGAVKINDKLQIEEEFQIFVKPKLNPVLSDFCKKLTTIKQSDVDRARDFGGAVYDFIKWIDEKNDDYFLCSWGFYDKKQLKSDCELHQIGTKWIKNHMSIKHQHGKIINVEKGVGMSDALKLLNIELEGTHHRGIDDAKNIAKIFIKIFDKLTFE